MQMKRTLLLLVAACVLAACGRRETPRTEVADADTVPADSVVTDSVETEADPPSAADERFDDFIYDFMRNERFQRKHVAFPLPVVTDGQSRRVSAAEWRHDRLFSQSDVYAMLLRGDRRAGLEADTAVGRAAVEWIYLETLRVKRYEFLRRQGRWMLTSIDAHALREDEDLSFFRFYHRFVTDSLYQRRHVHNPLPFRTYDYDEFQQIDGVLDVDQWFAFQPTLPAEAVPCVRYGEPGPDSPLRVFVISSRSTEMKCFLRFRRTGSEWQLIRFEN